MLQTQKSAQKVLSAIGEGLAGEPPHGGGGGGVLPYNLYNSLTERGCAAGSGRIFTTGPTIMGSHFQ